MKKNLFVRTAAMGVAILLLQLSAAAIAEDIPVTEQTLLDRIRIEDFMVKYYTDLGEAGGDVMAGHFTEDGILDVNNMVFNGRDEIKKIYNSIGEDTGEVNEGTVNTLVTNFIVSIDGDKAKVWLVWTNVLNESLDKPPQFLEQGKDYSELVKRDGHWLIKHRYVTSDGGAPEYWRQNYVKRSFR